MRNSSLSRPDGRDARLLPLLTELVAAANAGQADVPLFASLCEGLCRQAGVPLARSALQLENLHPVYYGYCLHWDADQGARLLERSRAFGASDEFKRSPYMAALAQGGWRWRAADGLEPELPLVRSLAATGITDFIAEIVAPAGALPPGITWATLAADGFTPEDAALLRALGPHLAPIFGVGAERRKLGAVARTYLGAAPGDEVLGGHIQRGDIRRLEAVVLLTDLRGFTLLTAALPEADLLALLNRYFEAVSTAVHAAGGQVLKFIGDGVLSVFPVEGTAKLDDRCRAAADAAVGARAELGDTADFTAVLHAGPLAYGNIGAPERLDFTVIGSAVNAASRIEAVAKRLGEPTVASAAVAHCSGRAWRSLGRHELRGVAEPLELLAPV